MRLHLRMPDEAKLEFEVARADAHQRRRAPQIERRRPKDVARS